MYLVQYDNSVNNFYSVKETVFFLGQELNSDEFNNFDVSENPDESSIQPSIPLVSLNEFNEYIGQCPNTLITADTSIDKLNDFFPKLNDKIIHLVIYVKDFKDGRTFSLIRHLKNIGYQSNIIVAGNYGLDQANYYLKSGATGFFVKDEQLDTLLKTLNDLKSGHFGNSVNKLPMFQ